jgi:hypothetical protein
MRLWTLGLAMAVLMAAAATASASWDVARDGETCAVTQSASGLRFIQTADALTVSLADRKLSWVEHGREYEVTVTIDRSGWSGRMAGVNSAGRSSIDLVHPSAPFVAALRAGSRISLRIEGTTYGPYSLSGSSKALADVGRCQAEAVARSAPVPAGGKDGQTRFIAGIEDWSADDVGTLFQSDSVTARMTRRERLDGDDAVTVEVHKEGSGSVSFEIFAPTYLSGTLGMARLDTAGGDEQFVFTNFTGGAHCCMEVRVVDFAGGGAKLIGIGTFDTGIIRVEDHDGDGVSEFIVPDERFRTFSSYAGSFPPYLVLGLSFGGVEDRTAWASFGPLHERMYALQSEACELEARAQPGACAGLVGTAARLGVHEDTIAMLDFDTEPEEEYFLPVTVCNDDQCSDSTEYATLREGIVAAVRAWGYIQERRDDGFAGFAAALSGKRFGADEGSELSCENGPTSFTRKPGAFGGGYYEIAGYESACHASAGLVLSGTAIVRAVCQGEGSPMWIENRAYSKNSEGGLDVALARGNLVDGHAFTLETCAD